MEQVIGDSWRRVLLQFSRAHIYVLVCTIRLCGVGGEGRGGRLQNISHDKVNLVCLKWIMWGTINASRILIGRLEGKKRAYETRRRPWQLIKNVSYFKVRGWAVHHEPVTGSRGHNSGHSGFIQFGEFSFWKKQSFLYYQEWLCPVKFACMFVQHSKRVNTRVATSQ
jgi:hypothetical protein